MKKLYRSKGTVHPSPPIITDHLSFLPATILTLAAALSVQDREVLAYLISCSSNTNFSGNNTNTNNRRNSSTASTAAAGDHAPLFHCSCFRCYTSYWARWDASPNRQLIHEIIDAFEDWLSQQNKKKSGGKSSSKKRNNNNNTNNKKKKEKEAMSEKSNSSELLTRTELVCSVSAESNEFESVEVENNNSSSSNNNDSEGGGDNNNNNNNKVEDEEKGSVRRFMSFIGEKIWGAWGQ